MDVNAFKGRLLLLTGANGGIGREVAKQFHAAGANLLLTDIDFSGLQAFAATLQEGSGKIRCMRMDSNSTTDADEAVRMAMEEFGGVDFFVPSAGIYLAHPVREMTDEQWRQTIAINLDGVFFLTRRVIPTLKPESAIVFISSLAAHRGAFYNAHYSASKGALLSLTRSLARELGPETRVNAVSPGVIDTPMATDLIKARGEASIAQTPLKRLGQPGEVASVIRFLCSQGASFITGETIHVNGGLHME
jgi:3-oxoacyl-[acyl-carrier protein] reductase